MSPRQVAGTPELHKVPLSFVSLLFSISLPFTCAFPLLCHVPFPISSVWLRLSGTPGGAQKHNVAQGEPSSNKAAAPLPGRKDKQVLVVPHDDTSLKCPSGFDWALGPCQQWPEHKGELDAILATRTSYCWKQEQNRWWKQNQRIGVLLAFELFPGEWKRCLGYRPMLTRTLRNGNWWPDGGHRVAEAWGSSPMGRKGGWSFLDHLRWSGGAHWLFLTTMFIYVLDKIYRIKMRTNYLKVQSYPWPISGAWAPSEPLLPGV